MSLATSTIKDNAEHQQPHVLSLYNNVPETDLSTIQSPESEPMLEERIEETSKNEETALGLKWEMGVARLPGSDIQFRMHEDGNVEVLTNDEDEMCISHDETNRSLLAKPHNYMNDGSIGVGPASSFEIQNGNPAVDVTNGPTEISQRKGTFQELKSTKGKSSKICEFCGRAAYQRNFMGRFCSKVCIAKHASVRRKKRQTEKLILQPSVEATNSGIVNQKLKEKKLENLKLKIRIPRSSKMKFKSIPQGNLRAPKGNSRAAYTKRRKLADSLNEVIADYGTFNWETYLAETNSKALDYNMFEEATGRSAYSTREYSFTEGFYMEAIDPMHQSIICLTSIVQIEGFRMRLHFEGYLDCFDFWVDLDSPFVFPCGFCEKTGRQLSGPENVRLGEKFVPETAFSQNIFKNNTNFKIGDKLEAVDRKNPDLICVATIADVIDDHVLVHFDGWEKDYDYWANSHSPFIHPVGWCEGNNKVLSLPPAYNTNDLFSWKDYLNVTKAAAAESSCFTPNMEKFEENMKLEVVDQRNPLLIRVATIVEVTVVKIKIHFDGWSSSLDDWVDIDSRNIHPIGWCAKTGYPLHPPINNNNFLKKSCPIEGCSSLGHVNSPRSLTYHKRHYSEHGCPYSLENLSNTLIYDRFSAYLAADSLKSVQSSKVFNENYLHKSKMGRKRKYSRQSLSPQHTSDYKRPKLRIEIPPSDRTHLRRLSKSSNADLSQKEEKYFLKNSRDKNIMRIKEQLIKSSVLSSLAAISAIHLPIRWDENVKQLPGVKGIKASHVMKWDLQQVVGFVKKLTGKEEYGDAFKREEIDGEALLLLTQNDYVKSLKLKLGPAIKVYNAVLLFKAMENDEDHL